MSPCEIHAGLVTRTRLRAPLLAAIAAGLLTSCSPIGDPEPDADADPESAPGDQVGTTTAELGRHGRRDFVVADGTGLRLHGRPYHFVGTNYWQAMNLASRGPGGDRARFLRELDALRDAGITNLRIMAITEGPDSEMLRIVPALVQAPGVYDEDLLDGLDFAIAAMRQRGMKAVMTLGNEWHWSGGFGQYLVWTGAADSIPYPPPREGGDWDEYQRFVSQFYGDPDAVSLYLENIENLVERVNRYTHTRYRDEPAIMAWELANEPRALQQTSAYLDWIATSAAFIKQLDPNHLVTTGSEGDTSSPSYSGTEYLRDHSAGGIDYGTAHFWVQNWGWYDPLRAEETYGPATDMARAYIASHVERTALLDKPIVFEEFGLARDQQSFDPDSTVAWRDRYYGEMLDDLVDFAQEGQVAGTNSWAWAGEGRPVSPFGLWWVPGDPFIGDPPHEQQGWYSIYDTDASTMAVIAERADAMSDLDCRRGADAAW
ncbi:MAG TPA: cellulase family glycosylhydrolase [Kofleriaceae bacterium]|nr:cellulase family glycosylhydrolase [Kofleriaceae bacterium]